MEKIVLLVMLCAMFFTNVLFAMEPVIPSDTIESSDTLYLNTTGKQYLRNGIIIAAVPVTFLVSSEIWDWNNGSRFKSGNEGMFGMNTDYAGHDKICHFFAHYVVERSLLNLFDYTENGSLSKYLFATSITASIGVFIEIGDGFSSSYGFGAGDLIMDMTGILAAATLEYFPAANAFLGFSCTYVPTKAFQYNLSHTNNSPLTFINDYSGWKFLMNFKLAGFEYLGWDIPDFLRYVQFDVGFTTSGFTNIDELYYGEGNHSRTRDIFVGISLNSAEVTRSFFTKGSTAGKIISTPLEYYHLPIGYTGNISRETSSKTVRHE